MNRNDESWMFLFVQHAIESIWVAIEDLIDLDQPVEVRHAAFRFLSALIDGQSSSLGNLRAHFFEILKKHKLQEDLHERLMRQTLPRC